MSHGLNQPYSDPFAVRSDVGAVATQHDDTRLAEETLIGLLLTGWGDAYLHAVDLEAEDFEDCYFGEIFRALTPLYPGLYQDSYRKDTPPTDILDALDRAQLLEPAASDIPPLPLYAYYFLAQRGADHLRAVSDLGTNEALSGIVLRIQVAAANRRMRSSSTANRKTVDVEELPATTPPSLPLNTPTGQLLLTVEPGVKGNWYD